MAKSRQQVLEVGLMNYLWPALTIVFSLFLLNKKAGPLLFPGALLAVVGIFFVIGQEVSISWTSFTGNFAGNPLAYSFGLLAAIFWALYSNLTRRWAERSGGGVELFIPATGVFLLTFRLFNPEAGFWTIRAGLEADFFRNRYRRRLYSVGPGDAKRGCGSGGGLFLLDPALLNDRKLPVPRNQRRDFSLDRLYHDHCRIHSELDFHFRSEHRKL